MSIVFCSFATSSSSEPTDVGRVLIEVAGRFIGQQQQRFVDHRPTDGHPLPLSAGKLGRPMRDAILQSDTIEQSAGTVFGACFSAAGQRRDEDVLQHVALRQQVMVLKDEADLPVAKVRLLGQRKLERIGPPDRYAAGSRLIQHADDVQQRTLTRPARPGDDDRLPPPHRQRSPGENVQRPGRGRKFFRQAADVEIRTR